MMTLRSCLTLAVLSLAPLCGTASAQVLYVDANLSTGANDGSSWSNALQGVNGLQKALAQVSAGEQIYVADGLYKPSATQDRGRSFRAKSNVQIYGGFLGGEASPAERPPFDFAPSILSGDLLGNDSSGAFGDNSYHVLDISGTAHTALVDGFRIQSGNADDPTSEQDRGAGVLALNDAQALVQNCRILSNRCIYRGGGCYAQFSRPRFVSCSFEGNDGGESGGGLDFVISHDWLVMDCSFVDNTAEQGGGLAAFNSFGAHVLNSVFVGNQSTGTGGGGGLWLGRSSTTLVRNCTLVSNEATVTARGGISVSIAAPTIRNSILWNNLGAGGGMAPSNQINLNADVDYCLVQGGFAGFGNLGTDPLFVDQAGGNYRLTQASPAIDAGANGELPPWLLTDFDGKPRLVDELSVPDSGTGTGPIVDMGSFEAQNPIGSNDPGCLPLPNSTGQSASLSATGSLLLAQDNLTLTAAQLPPSQFGYFVMSQSTASLPVGSGVLCLGTPQVRYVQHVLSSSPSGQVVFSPSLANPPQGQTIQAGQTWWFQLWHRDLGATSNFTNSPGSVLLLPTSRHCPPEEFPPMQLHSKAAILTVLILAYSLTAYGHTSAGLIFRGIASEPVTTTYSIPTNRRGLQLRAMEKSPVDGSMVVADHFESTPWAAHFVAAIRSHDVVVAGKNDPPANSLTIQRWTYCPPAGAYWIDRGLATSTPLGTAVSTPRAEVKVSGDRWTKPSLRAPMTVAKSTVYVGRDWSEIRDICADPDGRFLVILAKASSNNKFGLYQLSLDASQGLVAPTLIADETRYAAIADLSSIFPRDKEGYGRVYLSNTFKPSDDRIALMDPENDGASFVASAMTYAQYKVHPAVVSPDRVFTIIETP